MVIPNVLHKYFRKVKLKEKEEEMMLGDEEKKKKKEAVRAEDNSYKYSLTHSKQKLQKNCDDKYRTRVGPYLLFLISFVFLLKFDLFCCVENEGNYVNKRELEAEKTESNISGEKTEPEQPENVLTSNLYLTKARLRELSQTKGSGGEKGGNGRRGGGQKGKKAGRNQNGKKEENEGVYEEEAEEGMKKGKNSAYKIKIDGGNAGKGQNKQKGKAVRSDRRDMNDTENESKKVADEYDDNGDSLSTKKKNSESQKNGDCIPENKKQNEEREDDDETSNEKLYLRAVTVNKIYINQRKNEEATSDSSNNKSNAYMTLLSHLPGVKNLKHIISSNKGCNDTSINNNEHYNENNKNSNANELSRKYIHFVKNNEWMWGSAHEEVGRDMIQNGNGEIDKKTSVRTPAFLMYQLRVRHRYEDTHVQYVSRSRSGDLNYVFQPVDASTKKLLYKKYDALSNETNINSNVGNSESNAITKMLLDGINDNSHNYTIIWLHAEQPDPYVWRNLLDTFHQNGCSYMPKTKLILPLANKKKICLSNLFKFKKCRTWNSSILPFTKYFGKCFDKHLSRIKRIIFNEIIKYNVHPQNILVGGSGEGGALAIRTAIDMNINIGGVASIRGWLPIDNSYKSKTFLHKNSTNEISHNNNNNNDKENGVLLTVFDNMNQNNMQNTFLFFANKYIDKESILIDTKYARDILTNTLSLQNVHMNVYTKIDLNHEPSGEVYEVLADSLQSIWEY